MLHKTGTAGHKHIIDMAFDAADIKSHYSQGVGGYIVH